jgi:hypothetical protein
MTSKQTIRARAQVAGILLEPALKQSGAIRWWLSADHVARTDPRWQAAEALIDWKGTDPAALFDEPPAPPPVVRSAPPAAPTMWQRTKGWFSKKLGK